MPTKSIATTTENSSYYSVDCSSSTSASAKVIYYGITGEEIPKNTFARCSRCDALIEAEDNGKYNKFEISSNNTATSNNFRQVFFYCDDCMRWMRRKRWIRLLDNQKRYGLYKKS